jgi:hypothetical protein
LEDDFIQVMNIIIDKYKNREFGLKKDKMDLRPIMRRFLPSLLFLTFILGACAPRSGVSLTDTAPAPPTITLTSPPESVHGVCGYQWTYKDLPELSTEFQQSIRELQPDALANAFAFGEDCVYADGSRTFLAMETNFNITLQVVDVNDEEELGDWIVKVMQVVLKIPQDKILGPRPGRVSVIFQAGEQSQGVNFFIDQYQALSPDLSNAEIYQALRTPQ